MKPLKESSQNLREHNLLRGVPGSKICLPDSPLKTYHEFAHAAL